MGANPASTTSQHPALRAQRALLRHVPTSPVLLRSFAILSRIPAVQPGLPPNTYGISRVLLPLKHSASPDRFVMYSDALRGNPDNSLSTGGFATQWGNRLQLHVSIIYRV